MAAQKDLFPEHGGARPGAGRPKISGRRVSEPHRRRAKVDSRKPLHIVLRAVRGLRLRQSRVYHAIREALAQAKLIRICHMSIQQSHVHLIVEAAHAHNLSRGLQGFQISAARKINAALGTSGKVFADRYHAVVLGSPRQIRNTLAYVLNNWRHHDVTLESTIDPFSSASSFAGWKENPRAFPATYQPLPVDEPTTWLLRVGWRRHGPISVYAVPGGKHAE